MEVSEALLKHYDGTSTEEKTMQELVQGAAETALESARKNNKLLIDPTGVSGNEITLKTSSYTVTGTIDKKGGITWSDYVASTGGTGETLTNAEKAEKINDAIGQSVDYGKDIESYNGDWRVFYASEKEMFLISDDIVKIDKLQGDYSEYTNSNDVFELKSGNGTTYSYSNVTYGKDYNELWYKKLGENSMKSLGVSMVAYFCDPKNWTEYISSNAPKGTYAVGGPTKELFILSWNESYKNGMLKEETAELILDDSCTSNSGIGYYLYVPNHLYYESPISEEILDGLYYRGKLYYIPSPPTNNTQSIMMVQSGSINSVCSGNSVGIRPIISIPISNVQIVEDGKIKIMP